MFNYQPCPDESERNDNRSTYTKVASRAVSDLPEFATVAEIKRPFGIPRSTPYELAQDKQIRFVRLRKRGRTRGRVLVDCDSVRGFINSYDARVRQSSVASCGGEQ